MKLSNNVKDFLTSAQHASLWLLARHLQAADYNLGKAAASETFAQADSIATPSSCQV